MRYIDRDNTKIQPNLKTTGAEYSHSYCFGATTVYSQRWVLEGRAHLRELVAQSTTYQKAGNN